MSAPRLHIIASAGLVAGGALGLAGSFAPSAALRGLAWGLDGSALVLAAALLAVHHIRRGNDIVAAGFVVLLAGETLMLSGVAMNLAASAPSFASGAALWAVALVLISATRVMPLWLRGLGFISAILFTLVALQVFAGHELTPLSQPLPFFAYPFLLQRFSAGRGRTTAFRNNAIAGLPGRHRLQPALY